MKKSIKPLIHWAGGKGQLLPVLVPLVPKNYGTYYEPFFGGGALYFNLQPAKAVLNDSNAKLMNLYRSICTDSKAVEKYLDRYQQEYNSLADDSARTAYYLQKRVCFNRSSLKEDSDLEMAALFIFLNRTCFNGVYRVNRAGKFNVSFSHREKITALYDENNLDAASALLQKSDIYCSDFADIFADAKAGDFAFIDPPYDKTFAGYEARGFSRVDQMRLAYLVKNLTLRGVRCIVTNSCTDYIKMLYSDYHLREVPVKRLVNRDGTKRVGKEIVITNYESCDCIQSSQEAGFRKIWNGTISLENHF